MKNQEAHFANESNVTNPDTFNRWHCVPFAGNESAYLDKIKKVTESPWNSCRTNSGYLLCRQSNVKAITGASEDGSFWDFSVWGGEPLITQHEKQEYQRGEYACWLADCTLTIDIFDLFQQRISCACGCMRVITGLCLPPSFCNAFIRLNNMKRNKNWEYAQEQFIDELYRAILNHNNLIVM